MISNNNNTLIFRLGRFPQVSNDVYCKIDVYCSQGILDRYNSITKWLFVKFNWFCLTFESMTFYRNGGYSNDVARIENIFINIDMSMYGI